MWFILHAFFCLSIQNPDHSFVISSKKSSEYVIELMQILQGIVKIVRMPANISKEVIVKIQDICSEKLVAFFIKLYSNFWVIVE
ncbi:MAG: hypothetical protein JXR61_11460 [Prolixibacteraceae bacterium]|nr:hypothetical protein [Prolixibacteraceae bacterium]